MTPSKVGRLDGDNKVTGRRNGRHFLWKAIFSRVLTISRAVQQWHPVVTIICASSSIMYSDCEREHQYCVELDLATVPIQK